MIPMMFKAIFNKTGITSIFVTHDKDDVKSIADKVVILKEGIVIKLGEAKDVE